MLRLTLVLAAVVIAAALTPGEAAAIAIYFGTPNNAVYCGMGPDSPHRYSQEYIHCYTPNDGFDVFVGRTGRVTSSYVRAGAWSVRSPVQALGLRAIVALARIYVHEPFRRTDVHKPGEAWLVAGPLQGLPHLLTAWTGTAY